MGRLSLSLSLFLINLFIRIPPRNRPQTILIHIPLHISQKLIDHWTEMGKPKQKIMVSQKKSLVSRREEGIKRLI